MGVIRARGLSQKTFVIAAVLDAAGLVVAPQRIHEHTSSRRRASNDDVARQ